jgi:hypothetical protein
MQLDYYQAAAAAVADEWSLLAWLQIIYQTSLATNAKRNNKKLWTQTTQELITGLGAPLTNNNQFTIGEEERASLVHTPLGLLLFFFFCTNARTQTRGSLQELELDNTGFKTETRGSLWKLELDNTGSELDQSRFSSKARIGQHWFWSKPRPEVLFES